MSETELRYYKNLSFQLRKALKKMDDDWKMQNHSDDKDTSFIYKLSSVEECEIFAAITETDLNYVLHRWFNYKTSTECERIFCKYGAGKELNLCHTERDIFIDGIPYDVKLTVYPKALRNSGKLEKDELIRWMYENQSTRGRSHFQNRLFIICCGRNVYESQLLKTDFVKISQVIETYMKNRHKHKVSVSKKDGPKESEIEVYADILYVW